MTRPAALAALALALVAGCSATSPDTAPPAQRPTPAPPAATKVAIKPVVQPLCPAHPVKNGPLSDQGHRVGQVGVDSFSYADDNGDLMACIAITKLTRGGVELLFVNWSGDVIDPNSLPLEVKVQYGADDRVAAPTDTPQVPTLLPGKRARVSFPFKLPAGVAATVTAGFLGYADPGVYADKVAG